MKLISPFVATIILVIITISIGIGVYMYLSSVTKTTTSQEIINCLGGDFKIINFNREKRTIDGLVGAWKFDEGSGTIAYDSSGNNNHGTIYGATWVDGKFGKALQFDGIDDYVSIATIPLDKDLTIVFWFEPTNITKGRQNSIHKKYWADFALTLEPDGAMSYYHSNNSNSSIYFGTLMKFSFLTRH